MASPLVTLGKALTQKGKAAEINLAREVDLTPAERKYYDEVTGSKYDNEELIGQVPSFKMKDGRVQVLESDVDKLTQYIDETVILDKGQGNARLPPSFYRGNLGKKIAVGGASVAVGSTAFANEDITGQYMNSRPPELTPSQIAKANRPQQDNPVTLAGAMDTAGDIASDVASGLVEAPRQVVGGVLDATKELAQFFESVIPLGTLDGGDTTEESYATADEPRSTTGGLIRGVSQFLTGFVPGMQAGKAAGLGKWTSALISGAATDAFFFDPHEERLSNLIQENEALANPVTDYLAADENDGDAEGRFKNTIEGLGLGVVAEGMFLTTKAIRANRINAAKQRKLIEDTQKARNMVDLDTTGLPAKMPGVPDQEFIPFEEQAAKASVEFKTGAGKAGDEAAQNINLNNIDSTEEVDQLIEAVAKTDAKKINKARREVITNQETERLADTLGMSVDDLLARRKGEAFNAEQAVAARKVLVASGENVFDLARQAATGSEAEVALFNRALNQHRAIQAQVSGLTAEAGRALQSFRIQAKSAAGQEKAIKEALSAGGGAENLRDIASRVSQFDEASQLNNFVGGGALTRTQKAKGMAYEYWINSLLSSPTTHAVNALSNSIVMGWSVGERKVASMIGRGLGSNSIPEGEALSQLFGIVQGGKDGFKLAWHAIKTGESSDVLTKVEQQQYKRITSENLNLTGVPGRFADFIGEAVRVPGRLLTAGDELFKTIGYRMELNAQAYRTAAGEGLEGNELAVRVQNIINNPPENIHLASVDASRYQTFTRELGERGQAVQGLLSRNPEARIIVPFLRTPTNIMKWVGERTPLAPISQAVRAEIMAGGARKDMALAKIATGSMAMAVAADYTISGHITGHGPRDYQSRSILMATGWQPYSIKIGDDYYSYQRLDPVGAFIGLAADATEVMGQVGESDVMDLSMAAVTAVSQNMMNKTYLSGVAEFFDMMSSIQADPDAKNLPAKRWIERLGASVIPSGVAQLERTLSPGLSATQGIIEKIQSRVPGWSESLPPRRNIFGEPIVLSGGLGPDIVSPIYSSTDKKDPVADEMVRQGALVRMPLKNIGGVELTTEQYDDYVLFYSGRDNEAVGFRPLHDKLQETMNSGQYQGGTSGPDGFKSEIISTIFAAYKQGAQAEMLRKYPEIKNRIDNLKIEKAQKLRGF